MLQKRYAHFRRELDDPDSRKLSEKYFRVPFESYLQFFFLGFTENVGFW